MNTTHSTKIKLFAQALGITAAAVLGVLANAGTAAADGHNIGDDDATWGAADGAEQRGAAARRQRGGHGVRRPFNRHIV